MSGGGVYDRGMAHVDVADVVTRSFRPRRVLRVDQADWHVVVVLSCSNEHGPVSLAEIDELVSALALDAQAVMIEDGRERNTVSLTLDLDAPTPVEPIRARARSAHQ